MSVAIVARAQQQKSHPHAPGWYAIGFECTNPKPDVQLGPDIVEILHFDGSAWSDEDGWPRRVIYKPSAGCAVPLSAADYFIAQEGVW